MITVYLDACILYSGEFHCKAVNVTWYTAAMVVHSYYILLPKILLTFQYQEYHLDE